METRAVFAVAVVLAWALCLSVNAQDSPEVERLKARVESLERTVQALSDEIAAMKRQQGQPAASPQTQAAPAPHAQPAALPQPPQAQQVTQLQAKATAASPLKQEPEIPVVLGQSQLTDYHDMSGYENAAPRPNNAPLDPSMRGFFPIPGTSSLLKFAGVVRLDTIADLGNNGNLYEFVPATIPVEGEPDYNGPDRTTIQGKASRLIMEFRHPGTGFDNLRIYYENDFFNDTNTPSMAYRLRQFYGQMGNLLVGHTFSGFMDPDVYPDTIDYEGVNAVMFKRLPQIRYTIPVTKQHIFYFSLEQPTSEIRTTLPGYPAGATPLNRLPDLVLGYRYETPRAHIQLSALARSVGFEAPKGAGQSVFGWGVNFTGAMFFLKKDKLSYQVAYGEGAARYFDDTGGQFLDAALDGRGQLKAIPIFGPMVAYTHYWSENWRSTATYGYVKVDPPAGLGEFGYKATQYASLNITWQFNKSGRVGLEYLRGWKEAANGASGTANRLDFVVRYDLGK